MNTTPILQRYMIYLLVFIATALLIYLGVGLAQSIGMEHYDRRVKAPAANGQRNDIGFSSRRGRCCSFSFRWAFC